MALTNFPNGVSSFGVPVMGAGGGIPATTGSYFFVDSGTYAARDGLGPDTPLATVDAAIALCTANNGDVIVVMPGHAESLAAAITMDVAGVTLIGIGEGSSVPTLTFTADVTINVTAAGCRISNFRLALGVATVAVGVTVAAADVTVEKIESISHATSQFTAIISVGAFERVKILNNTLRTLITASATAGLQLNGCDNLVVSGNLITGHFATAGISNVTDEVLNALIIRNVVHNTSATGGDLAVQMDGSATGLMVENYFAGALAAEANYDEGAMLNMETYYHDSAADSYAIVPGSTVA
jgi:hypothetical protein